MKESTTYQAIVEEGRVEGIARGRAEGAVAELKKMLRTIGEQAFGEPDAATLAAIEKLNNLERLEDLLKRVYTADDWADLSVRRLLEKADGDLALRLLPQAPEEQRHDRP
jgi:hypothetical protein